VIGGWAVFYRLLGGELRGGDGIGFGWVWVRGGLVVGVWGVGVGFWL